MTGTLDEVCYTTRERVQNTLNQADSVRNNRRIDDCVRAASRDVSNMLHRNFWPQTGVRYPDVRWANGDVLWVNHADYEILSLTSFAIDGRTQTENVDYFLDYQVSSGAFTAVRLIRTSNAAWSSLQRTAVFAGSFGGSDGSDSVGTLAASISDSVTQLTVSDGSLVGVGDLLLLGAERMIVTEKGLVDSTATVTGSVAASNATTAIPVSSGALVHQGETITVGSERMFVESVAGNNLIVKRAANASVLAAHVNTDAVYVSRLCTVRRAVTGTDAAAHTAGATLSRNAPPPLVQEAAHALAIVYMEQGKQAWSMSASRTASAQGPTESATPSIGAGVDTIVASAYAAYGRKGRVGHRNV